MSWSEKILDSSLGPGLTLLSSSPAVSVHESFFGTAGENAFAK